PWQPSSSQAWRAANWSRDQCQAPRADVNGEYGDLKAERMARAEEVLHQVGLGDRMDHRPNELSGGQRQRVAVGRALVMKPSIVLADEPTGNLDTATSQEVMELFGDIQKAGNTVILVTHEEDIAAYAHRTVRLRDGRVESDA
ncbi:MAG: ATP-binding cassette domain-containing protein, partial [Flavobacteriales bacterium]|nr:ATP-binding cassette domain-containing protein [Flavobacteriales bacterium]